MLSMYFWHFAPLEKDLALHFKKVDFPLAINKELNLVVRVKVETEKFQNFTSPS